MEIVIHDSTQQVCATAARIIKSRLAKKPDSVLGLATGRTMEGVYRELRGVDLSQATTFNLDEYLGVGPGDPGSYAHYMREHLFSHVNLSEERIHLLDGLTTDPEHECESFEKAIERAGGIDVQLLGIGENGHIAFNEPGSSLASRTRFKTLASSTIASNKECFPGGQPPRHVLTLGVGTILESKLCLLLAFGRRKAQAVASMAEGPLTAMCPASALQLHPRTIVLLDEEAALQLKLVDYYKLAYEQKPDRLKY
jgi:glucosamine-6-phosphate deaminase